MAEEAKEGQQEGTQLEAPEESVLTGKTEAQGETPKEPEGSGEQGVGAADPSDAELAKLYNTEAPKREEQKQEPEQKTEPKAEPKEEPTQPEAKPGESQDLDLKVPEGVQADDGILSQFKELAKAHKIPQDAAQKLINDFSEAQKKASEQAQQKLADDWAAQQKQWRESLKEDKLVGGEGLDENLRVANQGVAKFFDDDAIQLLRDSGLGNHPAFVRGFYRIGKAGQDDTVSGALGTSAPGKKSLEQSIEEFYSQSLPTDAQLRGTGAN